MNRTAPSLVEVQLAERSYSIRVGPGLLASPSSYAGLSRGEQAVVISNDTVAPLFGPALSEALRPHFSKVDLIVVPDGESHKNWPTLQTIFDGLIGSGCDRTSTVFALGGGVIGDLAGFAAACFMRGVPYVQVPTTLLAQVDSAVGGKTAINHPRGKNLIGAFHQPLAVIADIDVLDSLPRRELVAGLAEVIKYGAVADDAFLDWIQAHLEALLARDKPSLTHAVVRSCSIKASIVAADERESGLRAILNFGHTFAHAIETGTGHGTWLHGEAVGCGMAMAADLSQRLGLIEASQAERIGRVVSAAGLPLRAPALGVDRYVELMRLDKKAEAGELRFVLLDGRGRARVQGVDESHLRATIEAFGG